MYVYYLLHRDQMLIQKLRTKNQTNYIKTHSHVSAAKKDDKCVIYWNH